MYTVEAIGDYYVATYKIRKEDDFWVVYFPDLGGYYATNEMGKDILQYFKTVPRRILSEYLAELYGELTKEQMQEVYAFIDTLKKIFILERADTLDMGNQDEGSEGPVGMQVTLIDTGGMLP